VRAEGTPNAGAFARYDLVAIENRGAWSPRVRIGDDVTSSSDPGRKLLVRYVDADGHPVADVAHGTGERFLRAQGGRYVDRATGMGARLDASSGAPLRASALRAGKRASPPEPPAALRERARRAVEGLDEGHRRIASPARYPVGMSPPLSAQKAELLAQASGD
jgi:nicotinate phosphoribosyltransferase